MNKIMYKQALISSKRTNKHLLILVSEAVLGQTWKAKLSGVHRNSGQRYGQCLKPTMGGVERNKFHGLGPTGLLRKPPPSGGCGGGAAETEQLSPLQVCFRPSGAHR